MGNFSTVINYNMLLQKSVTRKSYCFYEDDVVKKLADLKSIVIIFKELEISFNQKSKIIDLK